MVSSRHTSGRSIVIPRVRSTSGITASVPRVCRGEIVLSHIIYGTFTLCTIITGRAVHYINNARPLRSVLFVHNARP